MAKPFPHTQVSHVARGGRRRSQSVTIPDSNEEDTQEQSIRRKQFLAQLRNERQKQVESQEEHEQDEEDHSRPVVTRVGRAATTMSMKRTALSTRPISDEGEDESHQPSSNQTTEKTNTMSMKKNVSSTGVIVGAPRKEITSISSGSIYSEENETEHGKQSQQIIQIPLSESKTPLNKQMSSKTLKSSNVTVGPKSKISNVDSFITTKGIPFDSSQASSIPYASSSTNLMSKSEIFDQDFHLDDGKDHVRRNDAKRHGTININGGEKYYSGYDRQIAAKSSATFMAAIIAVIIGIIAFALGLSSLVLVLLLRSTVYSQLAILGSNSTSSSSSSTNVATWTATCSSYTTLDDPTRSVFATGYALGCDNTAPFINRTTPIWIRFIGTGGTQLPLTTPGLNICGSAGTGWYSGVMPSSGQIVNGTACFTWTTSVCQYSQSISVANCGSFYIYLLPPAPVCMMRYCTI